MRVALVVASLAFLASCSDDVSPAVPTATQSLTSSMPSQIAEIPDHRSVPDVTGQQVAEARAQLEQRGFRVKVDTASLSSCTPDGLVLEQDPPAGWKREVGTRVTLGTNENPGGQCGLDLPVAEPELDAAGRAFVAFARGGPADEALLRNPVRLYLGGHLMHTIPSWRAVHRNSYGSLCPAAGYYASATCPFSATRTIAQYPGPMAVTSAPPEQPCSTGGTLAEKRESTVTLTPDESRSCVDYFAVELELGSDGRLASVNLILSEP